MAPGTLRCQKVLLALVTPGRQYPAAESPRRQDLPAFALPATPRRETRQELAPPPWRSLDELSFAVTALRFLSCPLIRGPVSLTRAARANAPLPFPAVRNSPSEPEVSARALALDGEGPGFACW